MRVTSTVLAARVGVWLLAVLTIATGIGFLSTRTVTLERPNEFPALDIVDVTPVGIALLSVGLLILAAALLAEGYVTTHKAASIGSGSTPDA